MSMKMVTNFEGHTHDRDVRQWQSLLKLRRRIGHMLILSSVLLMSWSCRGREVIRGDRPLSLADLHPDEARSSGSRLIALPFGMHRLNTSQKTDPLIVLVHGYASRGYEWVYPAVQLGKQGELLFYRWDWKGCPEESGEALNKQLEQLAEANPKREIEVFGHSYGGVITAIAAVKYQGKAPLKVHMIASPLAGHPSLDGRCSESLKKLTQSLEAHASLDKHKTAKQQGQSKEYRRVKLHQWRTRHELDGAFKKLTVDPQNVSWMGEVTRLPEHYRGRRLGHNWSISWVVDHYLSSLSAKKASVEDK